MRLFNDYSLLAADPSITKTVVTIGNFDGLHEGHRQIIRTGRDMAAQLGLDFAIVTFEPHPFEFFQPDKTRLRLLSPERKYQLLAQAGVDTVLAQHFDATFAKMTPEEFIHQVICKALRAKTIIVGDNFRFGTDRRGDLALLREAGMRNGVEIISCALTLADGEPVSSSRIRSLLLSGQVHAAARLLNRYHELSGPIIHGHGRATSLGFPTINIAPDPIILPQDAIYAAFCDLPDGRTFPAAAYIGQRSTLGHGHAVEAHLLGFQGDLYGARITLRLVDWLRKDRTFDNIETLCRQIAIDLDLIRNRLENAHD